VHADLGFGLEHDDLASRQRERTADGQSDNTCADDHAIQLVGH
jgi:hypothetical protein